MSLFLFAILVNNSLSVVGSGIAGKGTVNNSPDSLATSSYACSCTYGINLASVVGLYIQLCACSFVKSTDSAAINAGRGGIVNIILCPAHAQCQCPIGAAGLSGRGNYHGLIVCIYIGIIGCYGRIFHQCLSIVVEILDSHGACRSKALAGGSHGSSHSHIYHQAVGIGIGLYSLGLDIGILDIGCYIVGNIAVGHAGSSSQATIAGIACSLGTVAGTRVRIRF